MRKIPEGLRNEMAADPYMAVCALTGRKDEKIDWHHNLIFAGRQVNERWAILPLARSIHDRMSDPGIREKCDWIMLNRATDEELRPYCKAVDLIARRAALNKKYGVYHA